MVYTIGMEGHTKPWKETSAVDERMRLVMMVEEEGETVSEPAHRCSIVPPYVFSHPGRAAFGERGATGAA